MEFKLPVDADVKEIIKTLTGCRSGDSVNCLDETSFNRAKLLVVKQKITGITLALLDSDGYIQKQVTSKKRQDSSATDFSDRQLTVIKALEKVLKHCKQEGINLVGYSDELVAYPASCKDITEASVFALDIDTQDSYSGASTSSDLDI